MFSYQTVHELFSRGLLAARDGNLPEARRFLEWALRQDPTNDQRADILYLLADCSPELAEKRRCLEEALAYCPGEPRCRRALALLDGQLQAGEVIDPDRPAPSGAEAAPEPVDVRRFTCPRCGGRMAYTPDGHALACESCHALQSLEPESPGAKDGTRAENFLIAMATRKGHIHPSQRQTFTCQGCGVDFILPPARLTLTCPYCASAYVVRRPESRELIDPHVILPFSIDENRARVALKAWLVEQSSGAGLPKVHRGTALYLPAWSFEVAGQVPWGGRVQGARGGWEPLSGAEIVYHPGVVTPATLKLADECAEELRAFDLDQALPFDERYLADWPAETYTIAVGDASLNARQWAYAQAQERVRAGLIQPVRDLSFDSLAITIESFRLALLPVWLSHYTLNENRYQVVINGVTAAVRGQRPPGWLARLIH